MSFLPGKIKALCPSERPREKVLKHNTTNLTDVELLAIILATGGKNKSSIDLARDMLNQYKSLSKILEADIHQLIKTKYIGTAKAVCIKTIFELVNRYINYQNTTAAVYLKTPDSIYNYTKGDFFHKTKENLILICTDKNCKVISKDILTSGTETETLVDPIEIFKLAIVRGATYVFLAHNHPSNNINPSTKDIEITRKLNDLGKMIGIKVVDHIISTQNGYFSMRGMKLYE